jgi:hypothetical protein
MSRFKMAVAVIVLALGFTTGAWSQGMRGGMGQQAPQLFGEFKPVVGAGAQYHVTAKAGTTTFAYVIVGQENVEGNTGYWMEIRSENPRMPGEVVMKQLVVIGGRNIQIKRMIMQRPGQPPTEMPMGFMPGLGRLEQGPENSPGVKVGVDTITVPAGTFECDHYRKQEPRGTRDSWMSTKVTPYGLVKMSSEEVTMELTRILSNETSRIKGEPQQMNIPLPRR